MFLVTLTRAAKSVGKIPGQAGDTARPCMWDSSKHWGQFGCLGEIESS